MEKEEMISLKLLVDQKQKRVIFAEAGSDFVDILFSFLTLPLGTISRLVQNTSEPRVMGCLNSVRAALENLDISLKAKLLRPTNSSGHLCSRLKLNIDDTELAMFTVSHQQSMYLIEELQGNGWGWGSFLKSEGPFMVSGDLKVTPISTFTSFELLEKHGVKDVNTVEEKNLNLGLEEIQCLLKLSFLSKAPLTDLFFMKYAGQNGGMIIDKTIPLPCARNLVSNCKKMSLKIILRRSDRKLLYAEVEEDFVNYLLSLLIIPLGAVVKLLGSVKSLGCISNLYQSVEALSTERYMRSAYIKDKLLSPKLPSQIGCKIELLGMNEYFFPEGKCKFHDVGTNNEYYHSMEKHQVTVPSSGFIQGSKTFIVTDDLTVIPLSSIANISVLSKFKVPIGDIEKQVVVFGKNEALKLLEASLSSTSALSSVFNFKFA